MSTERGVNKSVALRYLAQGKSAPKVVAKGKGALAEAIKQQAQEHDVPIYRDPLLVDSLEQLPLGDEIPESLYVAVAEVLIFVYSLSGEQANLKPAVNKIDNNKADKKKV